MNDQKLTLETNNGFFGHSGQSKLRFRKGKRVFSTESPFRNVKLSLMVLIEEMKAEVTKKDGFDVEDASSKLALFQKTDFPAFDASHSSGNYFPSFFATSVEPPIENLMEELKPVVTKIMSENIDFK